MTERPSQAEISLQTEALIQRTAMISIAVAVLVMGLKCLAYYVTNSVALYSDALESVANILTAATALFAIRYSKAPADKQHPYGHQKAEYFAAVFEGALIILAAFLVLQAAWEAVWMPRHMQQSALGLAINIGAGVINAGWAWFLITRGRRWRSPALYADGCHLVTDVVTSIGVVFGLLIALGTGWSIIDPLLAAIVAMNILWHGYQIIRGSLSSLLDEAASPEIKYLIHEAIRLHGEGALEAHDIRTREAGRVTFVEFHLVVPGEMTVNTAHAICDKLEIAIGRSVEGARTVIHVEPETKAKERHAEDIVQL